jgi:hypothetical protein
MCYTEENTLMGRKFFMSVQLTDLMKNDGAVCPSCGKKHFGLLRDYIAEENAIEGLPALLNK